MINIIKTFIIFIFFGLASSECNSSDFRIQEDYFADHLIGFYLSSIDINTGNSAVEYFRYRIIQENSEINNLDAHYSLTINSND